MFLARSLYYSYCARNYLKMNLLFRNTLFIGEKMKKLIMLLAIVAISITLTNDIYAQGGKMKKMKQLKTNFVDLDGDGICDNIGTKTPPKVNTILSGTGFVDADGDGVCDNKGTAAGNGKRTNFVDADGDGVCDNEGSALKQRLHDGTGTGTGNGNKGMKKHGKK